jgi:hypothetical protein
MKIDWKLCDKVANVERLNHVVAFAALRIRPGEITRREFGPSTLDALHSPACDAIDASKYSAIVEVEQFIIVKTIEGTRAPKPSMQSEYNVIATLGDAKGTNLWR